MGFSHKTTTSSKDRKRGKFHHRTLQVHVEVSDEGVRILDMSKQNFRFDRFDEKGEVIPANDTCTEIATLTSWNSIAVEDIVKTYLAKNGYTRFTVTVGRIHEGKHLSRAIPLNMGLAN